MNFHRVYGPSLNPTKNWYAVSLESKDGRLREYINNEICRVFPREFAEVPIETLVGDDDQRAMYEWFGSSRKKDTVITATPFGLLARSLRSKNLKNEKFIQCKVFVELMEKINSIPLQDKMAGNNFSIPAIIQNTPPPTPDSENSTATCTIRLPTLLKPQDDGKTTVKSFRDIEEMSLGVRQKAKASGAISRTLLERLKGLLTPNGEELGAILGNGYLFSGEENSLFVSDVVSSAIGVVASKHGIRDAFTKLTGNFHDELINSMMVPDWVQLYVKLACKIPDRSWQTLLNYLNVGRSGKATDAGLLLSNNNIRAIKQMVFSVTRKIFKFERLSSELRGYSVCLHDILTWAIRESRLHNSAPETMQFNIKLDGRPLAGRGQVSLGIVPIGLPSNGNGNQSALSVYPLAIANCAEEREDVKKLITRINEEKRDIKENGILVDGKHFRIEFKVTLDLKALLMLIVKKDDENFELGGRGMDREFCIFCDAVRACKEHLNGSFDEVCLSCLQSKANIGNWTGIRDDLTFLLEENLSSITLCSLHCEMRNTEQLIGSLGYFAHKCNSLDECNESLSYYGPENTRGYNRIKVHLRQGQTCAVTKSNIIVTSFSGSTERKVLANAEDIVQRSLPLSKVTSYYKDVGGAGNSVVIGYVSFVTDEIKYLKDIMNSGKFTRDFGIKQETVLLDENKDFKSFLKNEIAVMEKHLEDTENKYLVCCEMDAPKPPPRKRAKVKIDHARDNALAELAATLNVNCIKKVFQGWNEIAMVMRDEVFEEDEEQKIDIFDVKCKLWGRRLRYMFGVTLGTGDYGHLTVDHSSMLLRLHRSFTNYSNQGFEASHKVHRALYSRATSHDQGGVVQSIDQIMVHWMAEMMLRLRFQFLKAKECIQEKKKNFYYRGCGWKSKPADWTEDDYPWIFSIVHLFEKMYGGDSLKYVFIKDMGTKVEESCDPGKTFSYDHNIWESNYKDVVNKMMPIAKTSHRRRQLYKGNKNLDLFDSIQSCSTESNTNSSVYVPPHLGVPPTAEKTSPQCNTSVVMPTSNKVSCSTVANERRTSLSSTLSRLQFSNIDLPPIGNHSINPNQIRALFGTFQPTDPFSLLERPPETAVDCAEKFRHKNKGNAATGVVIGDNKFSRDGLTVLRKYCEITEVNKKINDEEEWLDIPNDGLSIAEINEIKNILWNKSLTATVIKAGHKSMDVSSFSTLVKERYLDNFVIDTVITKYNQESKSGSTLYLPSEVHVWLKSNDKDFIMNKLGIVLNNLKISTLTQIMLPLHMNDCHWGLIAIDLANKKIYFDDGYRLNPESTLLQTIKSLLSFLKQLIPNVDTLSNINIYDRFGMPYQGDLDATGQGSGSCGVGVILSARDFLISGIPNTLGKFKWNFRNMRSHRKELMSQIVSWMTNTS